MKQTESFIESLLKLIQEKYGYDFHGYSRASFLRRIERFIRLKNLSGEEQLIQFLHEEVNFASFLEEITVNVTEMFRDPSFYMDLREKVLPMLATYPFLKIWIAGCSTGEEAYSIAILLKEEGLYEKSKIYATDINQKAIQFAKDGVYNIGLMKDYISNYHKSGGKGEFSDYYLANYHRVIMQSDLKRNIVFSMHNLVSDSSFNEFNLILCRNVLIYFTKDLQERVIHLFMESLGPLGFLALGTKESLTLSEYKENFETFDKNSKIYRKKY